MAVIPPFFLDTVVAIGERDKSSKVAFTATGFLYGTLLPTNPAVPDPRYRVYLVTNRHVIIDRDGAVLRFNTVAGTPAQEFDIQLKDAAGLPVYSTHPDPEVDIAVVNINAVLLQTMGIKF